MKELGDKINNVHTAFGPACLFGFAVLALLSATNWVNVPAAIGQPLWAISLLILGGVGIVWA